MLQFCGPPRWCSSIMITNCIDIKKTKILLFRNLWPAKMVMMFPRPISSIMLTNCIMLAQLFGLWVEKANQSLAIWILFQHLIRGSSGQKYTMWDNVMSGQRLKCLLCLFGTLSVVQLKIRGSAEFMIRVEEASWRVGGKEVQLR